MGHPEGPDSNRDTTCRRTRQATTAKRPRRAQQHPMGLAYRRCLGGPAGSIPVRMDLLQMLYPLGEVRRDTTDPRKLGTVPGRNSPD
jgi:hypothetical protein